MAPRKKSVLLFISETPCVEIFNEIHVVLSAEEKTQQVQVQVGAELTFKRPKEKESFTGRVVAYDAQCRLKLLKVTHDGEVHQNAVENQLYLGTQKQELALAKRNQAHARELHMLGVDENIHLNGPPATLPLPKPKVDRRPKRRNEQTIEALEAELNALPCFTQSGTKRLVFEPAEEDRPVYISTLGMGLALQNNEFNPTRMFGNLLSRLVPKHLRTNPAVSFSGHAGTAKLPSSIVNAASGFATANATGPKFELCTVVKNYLWWQSHPYQKKGRSAAHSSASESSADSSESSASSQPSVISNQPSVISNQPSAISNQPSAISNEPSVISNEPSVISNEPSVISNPPSILALPNSIHNSLNLLSHAVNLSIHSGAHSEDSWYVQ